MKGWMGKAVFRGRRATHTAKRPPGCITEETRSRQLLSASRRHMSRRRVKRRLALLLLLLLKQSKLWAALTSRRTRA